MKIIICLAIALTSTQSALIPSEKCDLNDEDCMKKQFQHGVPIFMAGMPEHGVAVLDVMDMDDFQFELSGLQFSLKNGKLSGMKNSIIDSVDWSTKNKSFQVVFTIPDCTVIGQYTAGGRILILPITGDGVMTLKLKKVQVTFRVDYEVEKNKNGKDFIALKKLGFDFDVLENANFNLTNLFNGNKDLSEAMLKFLNENWKQISSEFGRPMLEVAAKNIYKNVRTFFKKNVLEDIALVY